MNQISLSVSRSSSWWTPSPSPLYAKPLELGSNLWRLYSQRLRQVAFLEQYQVRLLQNLLFWREKVVHFSEVVQQIMFAHTTSQDSSIGHFGRPSMCCHYRPNIAGRCSLHAQKTIDLPTIVYNHPQSSPMLPLKQPQLLLVRATSQEQVRLPLFEGSFKEVLQLAPLIHRHRWSRRNPWLFLMKQPFWEL